MKQIIQHLNTGETLLEEVPAPAIQKGCVLIKTKCSLISPGTEKMLIEFSKYNLLSKARNNPERVKQVLDKIKSDGIIPTLEAVFKKLDQPLPLGYCNAGEVIAIADDITEFKVGDRVISNGGHAEFVCIPKNLVAKIPDNVEYEEAVFTVIAAIGLQSIRLAQPQLGEIFVVFGLGLVGILTAKLLAINGCKVVGFDIDEERVEFANTLNINSYNINSDVESIIRTNIIHSGVDAVIITAAAQNDKLISTAAKICRKKARIILVGIADLKFEREEFYKKELQFQISCSYGPGRYDESYEDGGIDYPLAYVRWTEKRNFESILECLQNKTLDVKPLISGKFVFSKAADAYKNLTDTKAITNLLVYDDESPYIQSILVSEKIAKASKGIIGIIGAGNFASMTLLPALKKNKANIKYISSASGLNAQQLAKKYNIENAVSNNQMIFEDPAVELVVISTRHDTHAELILQSITHKKHIFTEKPIAINAVQLSAIEEAYRTSEQILFFTGFNRRHAPLAVKAKQLIGAFEDLNIVITVNAGILPSDHWLHNEQIGGGRIIGEACHFFDLMSFFASSDISDVYATDNSTSASPENSIIHLTYKNGVQGVINYFSNGNKSYPKEKIEIYSGNRVLILDNFKKLTGYGFKNFSVKKTLQNKGHQDQFESMVNILLSGGKAYTSFSSLVNTTKATFAAVKSIREKNVVKID